MTLNREQILNSPDLQHEEVFIPEWNDSIIIREMTAEERDQFETFYFDDQGKRKSIKNMMKNIRARLVAFCAIDEQGNRLFTEEDIETLGKKSARIIDRLYDVAQRLSGITKKDIEDLSKNLKSGRPDISLSDSPASSESGT